MPRLAALPARYPPTGAWPAQMRADMAAAYLDYRDTAEMAAAVSRGDAPAPSSLRGTGRRREPIWARADLDSRLASGAHQSESAGSGKENLAALV
jgi:hypothetical protein